MKSQIGAGKSSLADTIPFALFGKVQKNINLEDIINWKNEKNCEVELSLKINRDRFKICRGLKPNIFEVYKNDSLAGEFPDKRDYQKWLEDEVLGIDFAAFTNLIYLNLNKQKSILDMKKVDKRAFIERLFDLQLFKLLNDFCNKKSSTSSEKIRQIESSISTNKQILSLHKEKISELTSKLMNINSSNDELDKYEKKLEAEKENLDKIEIPENITFETIEKSISNLKIEIQEVEEEISTLNAEKSIHQSAIDKFNALIDDASKRLKKMQGSNQCPLCWSEIDTNVIKAAMEDDNSERNLKISDLTAKKEIVQKSVDKLKEKIADKKEKITRFREKQKFISEREKRILQINSNIESLENNIRLLKEKIKIEEDNRNDIINEIDQLKDKTSFIESSNSKLISEKTNILKIIEYVDFIKLICRDEEVKQFAISTLVPFINKQMNYYLSEVGQSFYVVLDKWLEEKIKGPGITKGKYGNLSGGEAKTVDLACQQAIIDIVKMLSTTWPDIMIFDELLDSSLDGFSLDKILGIVKLKQEEDNSKAFIISHRKEVSELDFDNIYLVEKKNGFSNLIKM